jgi:hypothetical protein
MRHEDVTVGENFKVTTLRDDSAGQASTTITFEAFGQVFVVEKKRGGVLTEHELPAPVTLDMIAADVCKRYGVTVAMLRSRNNHRMVGEARRMFIFLARKKTIASFPDIGWYLGRHHTSCITAFRIVERHFARSAVPANDNQECAQMNSDPPSDVRSV